MNNEKLIPVRDVLSNRSCTTNVLRLRVKMGSVAENGRKERSAPESVWMWRMGVLTRDGTAETVSRDNILRRERGKTKPSFSLLS